MKELLEPCGFLKGQGSQRIGTDNLWSLGCGRLRLVRHNGIVWPFGRGEQALLLHSLHQSLYLVDRNRIGGGGVNAGQISNGVKQTRQSPSVSHAHRVGWGSNNTQYTILPGIWLKELPTHHTRQCENELKWMYLRWSVPDDPHRHNYSNAEKRTCFGLWGWSRFIARCRLTGVVLASYVVEYLSCFKPTAIRLFWCGHLVRFRALYCIVFSAENAKKKKKKKNHIVRLP